MKKHTWLLTLMFILLMNTISAQTKQESLKVFWPDEYKWKIGSDQETKTARMIELIPGNETINHWSMIGTMVCMKGVKTLPINSVMKITFDKTRNTAPQARLVVIERNESGKNPWVIFKIDSPVFTKSKATPESQLYYIIQGNQSLFTNFIAVKQSTLGPLFVEKWTKVFKGSKLVYN